MTRPADSEARARALIELMDRQQSEFSAADGDAIRRFAGEIEAALKTLFQGSAPPVLSAQTLARIQIALDRHARLLAAANARVERGLAAMGLDSLPIAKTRSRFAPAGHAHGTSRMTA